MGADMTLHVEVREDKHWECVRGVQYEGRNYPLFGQLAGVRNDEGLTPLAQPLKELPEDVSKGTYFAAYIPLSRPRPTRYCLTLKQLETIDWEEFGHDWNETEFSGRIMRQLRALATNRTPADVRIIFWFTDA